MSTMNISLPEPLKQYVETQAEQGQYSTVSEYLRELIRADRDKKALRDKIIKGIESPLIEEDAFEYLQDLQERMRATE